MECRSGTKLALLRNIVTTIYWFLIAGLLLVGVALTPDLMRRLPVSTSIVYLVVGLLLGPTVSGLLNWDVVQRAVVLEHLTEIAVIISLFTVGLKLRRSLADRKWLLPLRLATITMLLTIAAIALIGMHLLGLSLGGAVLLGAMLAPTDPVLASEVQVQDESDRDTIRYGLSGEGGLNDGAAFPFVMLGLGMLGLHPKEDAGLFNLWANGPFTFWSWLGWDVLWAVVSGLFMGWATGRVVGEVVLHLRRRHNEAFGTDEFLVLGLIALAYGLAELVYGYGFLAVFAAGYALRHIEMRRTDHAPEPVELDAVIPNDEESYRQMAAHPEKAAQYLAVSLLSFNDQLERIGEALVVVLLGALLTPKYWSTDVLWLAPLLFFVVRPLCVALGLWGSGAHRTQIALMGWFGIRGIGSIYYLMYAITHGMPTPLAERLASIVLSLVAISIVVHGISVTPLMSRYQLKMQRHQNSAAGATES